MRSQIVALFLVLGLGASITACAGSNNTESGEDSTIKTEEAAETENSGQDIPEGAAETEELGQDIPEETPATEDSGQDIPEEIPETEEKAN